MLLILVSKVSCKESTSQSNRTKFSIGLVILSMTTSGPRCPRLQPPPALSANPSRLFSPQLLLSVLPETNSPRGRHSSSLTSSSSRPEDDSDPSAAAHRRNQTTAVILCGVLGALFDLEQERAGSRDLPALGTAMVRLTAKALMYLVLAPPDQNMPR